MSAAVCPACGAVRASLRRPLTTRQAQIMGLIRTAIATRGAAPTFNEIAAAFGFRSLATVHEHLRTLEAKGYIRRAFNQRQAITLVDDGVLFGAGGMR